MPDHPLASDLADPTPDPPKPPRDALPVESRMVSAVRPPRPGFWEAVLWTIVYGGVLQLVVAIGAGIVAVVVVLLWSGDATGLLSKPQAPGFQPSNALNDANFLTQSIALGAMPIAGTLLAFGLIRWTAGKQWRRRLALFRPGLWQVSLAILGLPALIYLDEAAYQLAILAHLPTFNYQQQIIELLSRLPWWFSVLTLGLVTAIAEELFFRGFLGRGLVARFGYIRGVLLTSFFFGVVHFDPPHIVATFVLGLGFHYAYLMTRSLWTPILLHFLNNSLSILAAVLLGGEAAGETIGRSDWLIYGPAALLALAIGWALYRGRPGVVSLRDATQSAWQLTFPGVECPPPQIGTTVFRPRPGWPSLICVVLALLIFSVTFYLTDQL